MVQNGQLRKDSIGLDAYQEMVSFFRRYLGSA